MPNSVGQGRGRRRTQTSGPHARTNEVTRTGPTAERATTPRRTLQRDERATVQGPVRKPTKDEMSHGGGGGGARRG